MITRKRTEVKQYTYTRLAEIWKLNCHSVEIFYKGFINTRNTVFITQSYTSISLYHVVQCSLHLSRQKFLMFKKKKKRKIPHRNERVVPNASAATLFCQSQGHRHTVFVRRHPCMNTKLQTWKSSPAFQLSSSCHCGKKRECNKKDKEVLFGLR